MNDFYEGTCPIPTVFETEKECLVIYDHEGNVLTQKTIKLGFDLSPDGICRAGNAPGKRKYGKAATMQSKSKR